MNTTQKPAGNDRTRVLKRAIGLEVLTIVWNVIEGIIAIAAGTLANSVALISFGIDSFIETTSAVVLHWRLSAELDEKNPEANEQIERKAGKIAGALLLCLAAYIVIDASRRLLGFGAHAEESGIGLILTAISVIVMPLVAWQKLKAAKTLNSKALRADAYETITCTWLSITTFCGLALNAWLNWWWADPIAALLVVPLVVKEGLEGWRDEDCHDCAED